MVDELIDICDERNNLLGIQKKKSEAHREGLWHRASHIWIYNSKGEILLQLRAKDKSLYPDMWDISAAGHVSAGEDPVTSGLRELKEEVGLKVSKRDLQFFKIMKDTIIANGIINNEFDYVYFLKFDGDFKKLKLKDGEVQEIRFIPIKKIEEELRTNPHKYTPRGDYWFEVVNQLKGKSQITIVGSMKFHTEYEKIKKVLEAKGYKVVIPLLDAFYTKEKNPKRKSMEDFNNELEKSDAILVANYEKNGIRDYIGVNVFMEIGMAFNRGKKIFILKGIPGNCKDELKAIGAIALNGNIGKIK